MDPEIIKLFEDDEDETMHSGADVDALQAQLKRDIGVGGAAAAVAVPSPQPPKAASVLSQGRSHISNMSFNQWLASQGHTTNPQNAQKNLESASKQCQQNPSVSDPKLHTPVAQNQNNQRQVLGNPPVPQKPLQATPQLGQGNPIPQTTGLQVSDKTPNSLQEANRTLNQESESQYAKLQKMSNQQASGRAQAGNATMQGKQIPFAMLLPTLEPLLDKDRAMQLHALYAKLKRNEIPKDGFVRHLRSLVGDQMIRKAVSKVQKEMGSNQFPSQPRPQEQHVHSRMPSRSSTAPVTGPQSVAQYQSNGSNSAVVTPHTRPLAVQMKTDPSSSTSENVTKPQGLNHQSNSLGMQVGKIPPSSISVANQEKDQPFPQNSLQAYGNGDGSYQPYSGTNISTPGQPVRRNLHQVQNSAASLGNSQATNVVNLPKVERQDSVTAPSRVQGGSPQFSYNSSVQQNLVPLQAPTNTKRNSDPLSSVTYVKQEIVSEHSHGSSTDFESSAIPGKSKDEISNRQSSRSGSSTTPTVMVHSNTVPPSMPMKVEPNVLSSARITSLSSITGPYARIAQKKMTSGQKKPLEALGSLPPSKKQKVSLDVSDQSIDQLNDVTAVSGVNLREEEEQLFSGPKEDSQASETSRRIVREEEERMILQKVPLQKKLSEILIKFGLKGAGSDVERCLSLCVEERLRGLLTNAIRLSKQRADIEKARHRILITSDVGKQIMIMNQEVREEWEKKQAELEKLQKVNELNGDNGDADGEKGKDEGHSKSTKANKEEDDKMRTTAANVAARAAFGGDDMLSKWKLMAEKAQAQARQKIEGNYLASGSQPGKDMKHKSASTSSRNTKDNQEAGATPVSASGAARTFGENPVNVPETVPARTITIKDVIATLEREPQSSKSTLLYKLYEKVRS